MGHFGEDSMMEDLENPGPMPNALLALVSCWMCEVELTCSSSQGASVGVEACSR